MKTHFDKICTNVVYCSISYYTILLHIFGPQLTGVHWKHSKWKYRSDGSSQNNKPWVQRSCTIIGEFSRTFVWENEVFICSVYMYHQAQNSKATPLPCKPCTLSVKLFFIPNKEIQKGVLFHEMSQSNLQLFRFTWEQHANIDLANENSLLQSRSVARLPQNRLGACQEQVWI